LGQTTNGKKTCKESSMVVRNKISRRRHYQRNDCCLKTLLKYVHVESWEFDENTEFLEEFVSTIRGNLNSLGDGWLRNWFGSSLLDDAQKTKEILLLIRGLLAGKYNSQSDLNEVMQRSWGDSAGVDILASTLDTAFLQDKLHIPAKDSGHNLGNSVWENIARAFDDPSNLLDELQSYEKPGEIREQWLKKRRKQLTPFEIRLLRVQACILVGVPKLLKDRDIESPRIVLEKSWGCKKNPIIKSMDDIWGAGEFLHKALSRKKYRNQIFYLQHLIKLTQMERWEFDENQKFLKDCVCAFCENLTSLGDGWLRNYFGSSLLDDTQKTKEILLLIRGLLAGEYNSQPDLNEVMQRSWGDSDGVNILASTLDTAFLRDELQDLVEDTLRITVIANIKRAFDDPSNLLDELESYEKPGEIREQWLKKRRKQLTTFEIRLLRVQACILVGVPKLLKDRDLKSPRMILEKSWGCQKNPIKKSMNDIWEADQFLHKAEEGEFIQEPLFRTANHEYNTKQLPMHTPPPSRKVRSASTVRRVQRSLVLSLKRVFKRKGTREPVHERVLWEVKEDQVSVAIHSNNVSLSSSPFRGIGESLRRSPLRRSPARISPTRQLFSEDESMMVNEETFYLDLPAPTDNDFTQTLRPRVRMQASTSMDVSDLQDFEAFVDLEMSQITYCSQRSDGVMPILEESNCLEEQEATPRPQRQAAKKAAKKNEQQHVHEKQIDEMLDSANEFVPSIQQGRDAWKVFETVMEFSAVGHRSIRRIANAVLIHSIRSKDKLSNYLSSSGYRIKRQGKTIANVKSRNEAKIYAAEKKGVLVSEVNLEVEKSQKSYLKPLQNQGLRQIAKSDYVNYLDVGKPLPSERRATRISYDQVERLVAWIVKTCQYRPGRTKSATLRGVKMEKTPLYCRYGSIASLFDTYKRGVQVQCVGLRTFRDVLLAVTRKGTFNQGLSYYYVEFLDLISLIEQLLKRVKSMFPPEKDRNHETCSRISQHD
jgi:hypothetical protein